jgi:DNA-binding NtrC family response regulator
MPESTVLVISRNASLVGWVESEVERLGGLRLDAVDDIEVACARATRDGIGLIVVHLAGDVRTAEVARLLWVSSTLRRPAPVVAMSERYQVERAVTLFQLGVTDYLSRSHHQKRLCDVIAALALRPCERAALSVKTIPEPEQGLLSGVS